MVLAIIGSRSFNDMELLEEKLSEYVGKATRVVSGGAKGADSLAERWAFRYGCDLSIHLPDWKKHSKKAGFIRNIEIINECDECVAFWDGKSRGTQHSIFMCNKLNKKVTIVEYEKIDRGNTIQ